MYGRDMERRAVARQLDGGDGGRKAVGAVRRDSTGDGHRGGDTDASALRRRTAILHGLTCSSLTCPVLMSVT